MTGRRAIRVGVLGLGYMGRTHIEAYASARRAGRSNRIVAVADANVERLSGRTATLAGNVETAGDAQGLLFDPETTRTYADAEQLIADPKVDLVSVCTPTDTHVDLAVRALQSGKHVLVEKPVALAASAVECLALAARDAPGLCMPAMCMRFWPGWSWLKQRIDSGDYGRVQSAVFRRLATRPSWSGFYADPMRTGGALFDLHVHDADFVRWCFGHPASVTSTGEVDHVTTFYEYPDGPAHVVAEGGWNHSSGLPFQMSYTVVFDDATADFDFTRDSKLIVARDGQTEPVPLGDETGWELEVRHLLAAIERGNKKLDATIDEAVGLTRMLEAERRSLAHMHGRHSGHVDPRSPRRTNPG